MHQEHDDIVAVTRSVLSLMLDMEAVPSGLQLTESRPDRITGCVQISGAWQGAVVLQTSVGLVTEAASRMLKIQAEDVAEDDLRDVLAELTNMIGGNIKSMVPSPSFLSLPSVTTGHDFDFHVSGASLVSDVSLRCGGEPVRVIKCERKPAEV